MQVRGEREAAASQPGSVVSLSSRVRKEVIYTQVQSSQIVCIEMQVRGEREAAHQPEVSNLRGSSAALEERA